MRCPDRGGRFAAPRDARFARPASAFRETPSPANSGEGSSTPLYWPSPFPTEAVLSIFGKTDPNASLSRDPGSASGSGAPTILGPGAKFVGQLSGDQEILINGRFEGTARVDSRLTVGPSGDVLGDLAGRTVVVEGKVQGQILAGERAELLSTAVVQGSVQAPRVVISEGAQLEGKVTMSTPAEVEKAPE